MRRNIFFIMTLIITFVLSACGASFDPNVPPEIHYGEDICTHCNMIISEERFAAAYSTVDGEKRIFDDIGGMGIYHGINQEEVAHFWVHDYETKAWLDAENAFFVVGDFYTPMSFGVLAFSEVEQAEMFSDENSGMLMDFAEMMDHTANMPNMDGGMDSMQDGMEDMSDSQ